MLQSTAGTEKTTLYEECVYATKQLLGRKQTTIYGKCICFNATAGQKQTTIYGLCVYAAM